MLGLAKKVDVQLEPSAGDERAGEDTLSLPVDDGASRRLLRLAALGDELLEARNSSTAWGLFPAR